MNCIVAQNVGRVYSNTCIPTSYLISPHPLGESVGPNAFRRQLIWGYAVCKAGRIDRFMTAGLRLQRE